MKKLIALILAIITLLSIAGCREDAFPPEVSEYAIKHEMECLLAKDLKEKAVVGKDYVVYGTIADISYRNYEKGSADLASVMSTFDGVSAANEEFKDMMEKSFEGTMSYFVFLSGMTDSLDDSLKYDGYNYSFDMLKINKGDEVAFIVTCEDGYSPGTYKYIIKEKIWENRHSETTIEEDHDAELQN